MTQRENLLRQFYHPIPLLFHSQDSQIDTRKVLNLIKEKCSDAPSIAGKRVLIVGMPNVGKSSLLNTLREEGLGKKREEEGRGKVKKAARTGDQPGVTRKIPTAVKIVEGWRDGDIKHEEDDVYVLDTPGEYMILISGAHDPLTDWDRRVCTIHLESSVDAEARPDGCSQGLHHRSHHPRRLPAVSPKPETATTATNY